MNKYEQIKSLSLEDMATLIENAEDELMLPSCNARFCRHYSEDGSCEHPTQCREAIIKWLESEAE